MPFWKIPSGEITNLPYLRVLASMGEPIVMSTGMSTLDEVRDALSVLRSNGAGEITLLQCNTQYPTPFADANVRAMMTLKDEFGCMVGYSDHTPGVEASIAAVALGATIIEKHFTLDRAMDGPDQIASIEPDELRYLVDCIRHTEEALGSGVKEPSKSELENREIARKSIVANREIRKGELLSESNLACKRPGDGISPMFWDKVIGTSAIRDFGFDEKIEL